MSLPSAHDVTYRLFRLRRFYLFCLCLPLLGAGAAALIADSTLLLSPQVFPLVALIWATALLALILRFPRASMEVMCITLTVTILLALLPAAESLTGLTPGFVPLGSVIGMALLLAIAGVVIFFGMIFAYSAALFGMNTTSRRSHTEVRFVLPPEVVFAAVAASPNTMHPLRRMGPVDRDGFFDVTLTLPFVISEDEGAQDTASYRMKLIEQGPLWQNALIVTPEGATSAHRIEVLARGHGCTLISDEVHENFTPLMALEFWLTDFGSDHYVAEVDASLGRPSPALRLQPMDSPLTWLAARMPNAANGPVL